MGRAGARHTWRAALCQLVACGWLACALLGRPASGRDAGADGKNVANYAFCEGGNSAFPHCDMSKPLEERLGLLVDGMSLREKVGLLAPNATYGNICETHTNPVARLGVDSLHYLVEANTNIASRCLGPDRCATTFVGPLGVAANFNRSSYFAKGDIMSTEGRAFRNLGGVRSSGAPNLIGLTAYGPNINIVRDPRFGRISELASEDPFLSGIMGHDMVSGMQVEDQDGRPRLLAFLKHFTAYSVEAGRGSDNHDISTYDLFDTYLRQFEIAARAKPAGAMCSYNGVNGRPACANSFLLNDIFRKRFGLPNGIVSSDCSAISNLRNAPIHAQNDLAAVVYAFRNGTDLEMGSSLYGNADDGLEFAVKNGQISEADITTSVKRLMRAQMRAGIFDKLGSSEHDELGIEALNSTASQQTSYDIGLQAPVLLRNDVISSNSRQQVLPLSSAKGSKIAVFGSFAESLAAIYSDYAMNADPCINSGNFPTYRAGCVVSVLDGLRSRSGQADVQYSSSPTSLVLSATQRDANRSEAQVPGSPVEEFIPQSESLAPGWELRSSAGIRFADGTGEQTADVVVVVVGAGYDQERETLDRKSTDLDPAQTAVLSSALALGKPTVVILVNGGALSLDELGPKRRSGPPLAVVEAFSPNRNGALPLADLLFGAANRWGKLPYTIYPRQFQYDVAMDDFAMSKGVGRTYRYYHGEVLWPFGHGLSYTEFELSGCDCGDLGSDGEATLSCTVVNAGEEAGDEVLQIYHRLSSGVRDALRDTDQPAPIRALVAFERVRILPGEKATVAFRISREDFSIVDARSGDRFVPAGAHVIEAALGTHGGSADPAAATCQFQHS